MRAKDIKTIEESRGALKAFLDTWELPDEFMTQPDGIVIPDRLSDPIPQVTVSGRVNEKMFHNVSDELRSIEAKGRLIQGLGVHFASPGGNIYYGFGIHGLFRSFAQSHDVPVTITGYGPVMSMGMLIIQAAEHRAAPASSTFLLHPFRFSTEGSPVFMGNELEQIERMTALYCSVVGYRSGIDALSVKEMMDKNGNSGSYFSAREALEIGLIDEVI